MRAPMIIVVDDDPVFRKLISRNLEYEGCIVWSVDSAKDALGIAAINPPDIILADEIMPGMTGIELCRKLRPPLSAGRLPYTIVATAEPESSDPLHAEDLGVDLYIAKLDLIKGLQAGFFRDLFLPLAVRQQLESESTFLAEAAPVAIRPMQTAARAAA